MPLQLQTGSLLAYAFFAIAYLGLLSVPKKCRDILALGLLVFFCLTLGLRDPARMPDGADPVIYASLLSNRAGAAESLLGGIDYGIFYILHGITGAIFGIGVSFFLLHLLYVPVLYLLYRAVRHMSGAFYLLAGWMLFVNSGVLLLANFFRQGLSVFLFLSLLALASHEHSRKWISRIGTITLPFLHLAATALIPAILVSKKRYYYRVYLGFFTLFCAVVSIVLTHTSFSFVVYFGDMDRAPLQRDLVVKVSITYLILIFGLYLRRHLKTDSIDSQKLQRAAIGFLIPTGSLLLTYNAPVIGLRYMYYSHAVAFLYLTAIVGNASWLASASMAVGLCAFGAVTWTFPTVARLLVW